MRFNGEGKIEPALAQEWHYVSSTTLRCRLRPDVHFSDGEIVDANSVRWSLLHQLDPKTGFPALVELSTIKDVRVIGSDQIDIETRQPDGLLIYRLAGYVKILPPKYYEHVGDDFGNAPIGTGPFEFVRWNRGESIELKANPNYWEKGRPKIDGIIFQFIPQERQIEALFSGKIDMATEIPGTRTLEVVQHKGTRIVKKLELTTPAFWFTAATGPLTDVRVRRALNLAIDKDDLIRYSARGNGQAIATLSMEGENGHDPELKPYAYSPDEARRLLEQAGVKDGFSLKLLATTEAGREANILAEQWRRIGVNVENTVLPMKDSYQIMLDGKQAFDVVGNIAPNPTAHMYFLPGLCFYSRSPFSRLKSDTFDRMFEELIQTIDPSEQARLSKKLDDWIYDQALGVFTYQKIRTYAVNDQLKFTPYVTGMLNLKDASWAEH